MGNTFKPPCDEGVLLASGATSPRVEAAEPWILAATILGSSMSFIDGTVVNVALPALQQKLNATALDMQWVVESYALFLAALLLVGGSLGDYFGRRFIYAIGVGLFAVASFWCGMSHDVHQLIVGRAIQGIGGALLVPGSLAIISASFSEERRGQAIGTWSGLTSITAAIGPVLGGWLVEHISWRAAFYINIPIALIVLLLVFWKVPESHAEQDARLDFSGAIFITIGLGSIVYGLIESSRYEFEALPFIISIIIGVAFMIAFFVVESRIANPMLPLGLFRLKNFGGANLLTFFLYFAMSGALFFYPLNLIQIQGYSATAAGAAFLPFILIMFLLSRWSGGLIRRYGPRLPLVIGPTVAAAGFLLFAIPQISRSYWTSFFPATVVLGLGMAISVAPLTTTVMNSVNRNQSGIASGINNAVSRIAGLLAIAIFGVVMLRVFHHKLDNGMKNLGLENKQVQSLADEQRNKLGGIELPTNLDPETRMNLRNAINQAFVFGFRVVMFAAAALSIAAALSAWRMIQSTG